MKITNITILSLIGVIVYIIIIILSLNIKITLKKKSTPTTEVTVLVEQPPMMYTWDSGDECYEE
jgi:hypothetical protein